MSQGSLALFLGGLPAQPGLGVMPVHVPQRTLHELSAFRLERCFAAIHSEHIKRQAVVVGGDGQQQLTVIGGLVNAHPGSRRHGGNCVHGRCEADLTLNLHGKGAVLILTGPLRPAFVGRPRRGACRRGWSQDRPGRRRLMQQDHSLRGLGSERRCRHPAGRHGRGRRCVRGRPGPVGSGGRRRRWSVRLAALRALGIHRWHQGHHQQHRQHRRGQARPARAAGKRAAFHQVLNASQEG